VIPSDFWNCLASMFRTGQAVIIRIERFCIEIMNRDRGANPLPPPGGSFWHAVTEARISSW